MAYADGFSRDPAANSAPPALGAPQGGLAVKRISATFRTTMAAIAECWGGAIDGAIGVKNLRGMATQDPAAVAITGGRIGADVVLEGGTTLVWGLSPQQFYDALYPMGAVQLIAAGATLLVPSLITASWVRLPGGYALLSAAAGAEGVQTEGGWTTSDAGAIVAWTGPTAGTTLTLAQVPAGLDTGVTFSTPTTNPQQANFGSQQSLDSVKNTGGGQPHTHPVTVPGASAHHHSVTPPTLAFAAWKRIA